MYCGTPSTYLNTLLTGIDSFKDFKKKLEQIRENLKKDRTNIEYYDDVDFQKFMKQPNYYFRYRYLSNFNTLIEVKDFFTFTFSEIERLENEIEKMMNTFFFDGLRNFRPNSFSDYHHYMTI